MRQFIYIRSQPTLPPTVYDSTSWNTLNSLNQYYLAINEKVQNDKIFCVNVLKFCSTELYGSSSKESAESNELMKNKLRVDFVDSGTFVGDLPVNEVVQQRTAKTQPRRESVAPKIVVCPPVEDMPEQVNAPRGARLLKALSRRLSRRANDADSLGSSSSNDSVSCENRTDDHSSCSASDSGSDGSEHRRRHRSTVSLRRVFQNLNLTSRSQSCSPTERQRQPKKQQQPQRILRPPITYTYVRGLSGLPTQRVPRHTVCCATMGLNR